MREVDDGVRLLVARMVAILAETGGIGLAAPQVGVLRRVFVMACGDAAPEAFIDPEIRGASKKSSVYAEGCLSIPGVRLRIARPSWIRLGWIDLDGNPQVRRLTGLEATCAQHEIDHLDGRLILDHREAPEPVR